jgi:hypothetical protein
MQVVAEGKDNILSFPSFMHISCRSLLGEN